MQIVRKAPSTDEAAPIAAAAFERPDDERNRSGVQIVTSEGIGFCAYIDDELVGFAIFLIKEDILYLNAIAVKPELHGLGITQALLVYAMNALPLPYIGWRTQSLRAQRAFRKVASSSFPHPEYQDDDCLNRATYLAKTDGFDSTLAAGVYGGPLFGEKPIVADAEQQEWWDSLCSFENGDAIYSAAKVRDIATTISVIKPTNPLARIFMGEAPIFPGEKPRFIAHVNRSMIESNKAWENRTSALSTEVIEVARAVFGASPYISHIYLHHRDILCVLGTRPEWDTVRPHWEWGDVEYVQQPDWAWDEEIEQRVKLALETYLAALRERV